MTAPAFVSVPVELTQDMVSAYWFAVRNDPEREPANLLAVAQHRWAALIAAAPQPPASGEAVAWLDRATGDILPASRQLGDDFKRLECTPLYAAPPAAAGEARDAARYRFLRNDPPSQFCVRKWDGHSMLYVDADTLDAMIDAAMTKAPPC